MDTDMPNSFRWYSYGSTYEYKSAAAIAGWPLLHICGGLDPLTRCPLVARGIIAIGDVAVGVIAIGGFACGLIAIGGASLVMLLAIGGAAVGLGVSVGGLAIGSIAVGGVAIGFVNAVGGVEFGMRNLEFGMLDRIPSSKF